MVLSAQINYVGNHCSKVETGKKIGMLISFIYEDRLSVANIFFDYRLILNSPATLLCHPSRHHLSTVPISLHNHELTLSFFQFTCDIPSSHKAAIDRCDEG